MINLYIRKYIQECLMFTHWATVSTYIAKKFILNGMCYGQYLLKLLYSIITSILCFKPLIF